MANWWQTRQIKRGVRKWNKWRARHPDVEPDLSGINLSLAILVGADFIDSLLYSKIDLIELGRKITRYLPGDAPENIPIQLNNSNLSEADLRKACLKRANLRSANLHNANLIRADLSGADLSRADLSSADLSRASLNGADLRGADLSGADLSGADLREANLSGTFFVDTVMSHINFCTARGIAEIYHIGPSPIHLPSLQLPQDGSALHFLRGVGLLDEQIDLWRAEMMYPIQYHSVFISYNGKDKTLAKRLHADLQANGVRCWFAPEDMKIGDKFRQRIDEAIHLQDKLLLLLSEHAIASAWVEDEVEAALEKEQHQHREVLFPVHLDESVMQTSQAWAAKLRRTRHIGDFTRWTDPQAYQQAFERLLRDLKAEGDAKKEISGKPGAS